MRSETQIQDEQFASILMELVMQYAELTESHVFLLVETETSRRFIGKKHLKELYMKGELKPCGRDSEIVVDPSLTQMVEVSRDKDGDMEGNQEEKELTELDARPRRHIGELPSERRERKKNEFKTYSKFVNMASMDGSFGTFLMEALMKYSCMNDASVFFLIETTRNRRFAGKAHLCEQYLEGVLLPTEYDVEMDLDTEVKVISVRRIPKPGRETAETAESVRSEDAEDGREIDRSVEGNGGAADESEEHDRKRNQSETSVDSDQPAKRKHVGLLPSERRELARKEREAKSGHADSSASERKHKGELPSERRERIARENAAKAPYQSVGRFGDKVQSGPGYIFGPSPFPPVSAAKGYGFGDGSYDTSLTADYGQSSSYKSSYGNWKSGGTTHGGDSAAKSSKSQYDYGW